MPLRSVRITAMIAALALSAAALAAQQTSEAPGARVAAAASARVMRAHEEFLADDALEGRAPATRGGETAALYLKAQFERLGLLPLGDSGTYFHKVPIVSLTPDPVLALVRGGRADTLGYRRQYVLWAMHDEPVVTVDAPAVFVGYGIVAPEYHWDDYAGVDARGKVVVVLVNDPGLEDSTLFRGPILTYYGRWTYKIEEAERHGAAGILLLHNPRSATYTWATVAGSWTGPQVRVARRAGPLLAAGWLDEATAARLLGADLPTLLQAAARRSFRARPLDVTVRAIIRSTIRRSTTDNVVAKWPGRGAHANEAVLIGAHYDHLGIGIAVNGDSIYNGAVDNASGTAAMLTAAEAFVQSGVHPGRSIIFMGFAAEESGLLGSTAFAERPTLPLRDLAAVLNIDEMNLLGPTHDISALGLDQSSLGELFEEAASAEGLQVGTDREGLLNGSFFRSDHFPFAGAGVPSLSLESGNDFVGRPAGWGRQQHQAYSDHRYHQPSDELLPSFDYRGAMQQLRVIIRTAMLVANATTQPRWNAGSEFRAAGERRRGAGGGR